MLSSTERKTVVVITVVATNSGYFDELIYEVRSGKKFTFAKIDQLEVILNWEGVSFKSVDGTIIAVKRMKEGQKLSLTRTMKWQKGKGIKCYEYELKEVKDEQ